MALKFQLHVSGLNLLSRCGIAFENRYLLKIPEIRSTSLIVGSAVDRAVTADLREKMEAGKLLPDDSVRDAARDALKDEWHKGDITVNEEDAEEGWTSSEGDAIDAAVAMAGHHHSSAAPGILPTAVQRPFTMDVNGAAMPLQVVGTIDVEEADSIRDTKTSGKSPKKTMADESIQLTMYSLAKLQCDDVKPGKVVLDYIVRTPKRKDLKLVQLESRRTMDDLPPLMQRIAMSSRIIQAGLFTPADPSAWWCSSKFCSYHATCPYAVRPVSVAVG